MDQGQLIIRRVAADSPVARELLAGFRTAIALLYPDFDPATGPSATPADFSPPSGGFLVADLGGRPVACGGIKTLRAPELGELKRMYVAPEARGRGVARDLLGALEDLARELGHRRLRLDTGPLQPAASHLYRSAGYRTIPDYNRNPFASEWFERDL